MKKMYAVVIICLLFFTSCAHIENGEVGIVSEIDDETIEYKGYSYEYWSNESIKNYPTTFFPFLSDFSTIRQPQSLNNEYIVDLRDINSNFIYFDCGILGTLVYKKTNFTIPPTSDIYAQPDKIDEIVLRHTSKDLEINITKDSEKKLFLSSLQKVSSTENALDSSMSLKNEFFIDGISSYYGGLFSFYEICIYEYEGDYFLYPGNIKMPEEINNRIKQLGINRGDG